jgi:hypothetical protein
MLLVFRLPLCWVVVVLVPPSRAVLVVLVVPPSRALLVVLVVPPSWVVVLVLLVAPFMFTLRLLGQVGLGQVSLPANSPPLRFQVPLKRKKW